MGRLRASDRLRKHSDFVRVQGGGLRVIAPSFIFLLAPPPEGCGGIRLGVTASRRVGNAVVRNRAKRLVREAFRAERGSWPSPIDVVVIVRRAPGSDALGDVLREWRDATPRIRKRWATQGSRAQQGGEGGPLQGA